MQPTLNKRQEMESKIVAKLCRHYTPEILDAIVREAVAVAGAEGLKPLSTVRIPPPAKEDIEALIDKRVGWKFDDIHIAASIKNSFPGWTEAQVEDELDKLELMYESEYQRKINAVWETINKECRRVEDLLNDGLDDLKNKIRRML